MLYPDPKPNAIPVPVPVPVPVPCLTKSRWSNSEIFNLASSPPRIPHYDPPLQTLNSCKSRTTIATLARFTASASKFLLERRSWLSASPPCAYELLGGGGGRRDAADVGVGLGTSRLDSDCRMRTGEDVGAADIVARL